MKHLILASGLLALAGCGNPDSADTADTSPTAANTATGTSGPDGYSVAGTNSSEAINPTDEASFLAKAGAADLWEVSSSKAALAKS